ncbi:MAG: TRAP transporter large permease subunit [Pigmentiphaga sp.]|nr:TRAP transporter large permease subunit [Pigmentiphaga sp.]
MDFPFEAVFIIGGLLVLMALSVPIGIALIVASFVGIASVLGVPAAMRLVADMPREVVSSWELSAIPMFLLMGAIALYGGLTDALFKAARAWLGWLPGGLAVSANMAAVGLGATTGSSLATTVAVGRISIPEMQRSRYDMGLAAATCASAGTIAALIPPSIPLIVYAMFAEQSLVRLFAAGVIPGLLTAFAYIALIVWRSWSRPELAPRAKDVYTWGERVASLREVWPLPVLVLGVFGGLYGGYIGPTEAGGFGSFLALLITIAKRRMSVAIFRRCLREAATTTALILFVAIGAVMLARYMALIGLPEALTEAMRAAELSPLFLILITSVIYLILGMFLDPMGVMLLSLPIFLPMFDAMGYDLIWFGIIVVKFIEIGLLTPPLGMNVFAVRTVLPKEVSLERVYAGLGWFLLAEAVVMVLLFAFPAIVMWLPNTLT